MVIFMKKIIFYLVLFLTIILFGIYILYKMNIIPNIKYTNSYFGIKDYISKIDKDNDGIDDQTDILNNVPNNYGIVKLYWSSHNDEPLKEYINIMHSVSGADSDVQIGALPYNDKQVMYLCADISALTADTGFVPQVSYEEGIKETVKWLKGSERNE